MNKLKFIVTAALVAAPVSALAQPIMQARCTTDSLDTNKARQRVEWARRCGLTLNTGTIPNTGNPNAFFQSTKAFDASTFLGANDYRENTSLRAFSGSTSQFEVNYSYGWQLNNVPLYTVFRETVGPTLNFFKWSSTTVRPQPLYPAFDTTPNATGTQLFPHPTLADCRLYTDRGGVSPLPATTNFFVVAYCESSCYTPDQNLRFSTGDVNILEAANALRDDLVVLSSDATLDSPSTKVSRVYSYTRELRDAKMPIWKVTTASGASLSITAEHPVLVSNGQDGRLIKAEKLREGDDLVKADGTPDPIVHIEKTSYFGKVYNIKPTATEHVSNILIAQGLLVGSARFQNDDIAYMNRALLFRAVPDEVMPK
jgi:hypothetical protein